MDAGRSHGLGRALWPQHTPQTSSSHSHPSSNINTWHNHVPTQQQQPPSAQYPGGGFDYRRPMSYSGRSNSQVIDLTGDVEPRASGPSTPQPAPFGSSRASRPPRYDREIIDLSADTPQTFHTQPAQGSSPEVQFVLSRTLPPAQRPQQDSQPPVELGWRDDGFEIVQIINRGAANRDAEQSAEAQRRRTEVAALIPQILRRENDARARNGHHPARRLSRRLEEGLEFFDLATTGFTQPTLDFTATAFALHEEVPGLALPAYRAPSEAPKGFTRSPAETDTLICPNCSEELCAGESDVKQQVWIIKACGHVSLIDLLRYHDYHPRTTLICYHRFTAASARKDERKQDARAKSRPTSPSPSRRVW